MKTEAIDLAYLCLDRGIPIDGTKGASVHLRSMGRALRRGGIKLQAVVARSDATRDVGPDVGFPVTVLPRPPDGGGLSGELAKLARSREVLDCLRELPKMRAVYERFSLFSAAGLALARERGVPFVIEVNAPLWREAARYRTLHLAETARALSLDLLRRADHVLVVSEGLRRTLSSEGVLPERIHLFPNGVHYQSFREARPAVRPACLRERPVMVFCGSLKPWHGIEFLLEAFRVAAARGPLGLWILGTGPLAGIVEAAARDMPDRIVVEGAVSHESIPSYLAAGDLAVAPYLADAPDYFCPLKVIEALAAGCPLVAGDVPCVRDLLGADPPAVLFAPGDVDRFVAGIEDLLEGRERRARMRLAGQKMVAHRFTWDARVEELCGMLGWDNAEPTVRRVREVRA